MREKTGNLYKNKKRCAVFEYYLKIDYSVIVARKMTK